MGRSIDIDTAAVEQIQSAIIAKITDISPLLKTHGETIMTSIQRNYLAGGRFGADNPYGGGSEHWIPSHRAEAEGGKTELDTGDQASRWTYRVSGDTLTISNNRVDVPIHQFGGKTGRNHAVLIPMRPIAVVQNEDLDTMRDDTAEFYRRQF